jgi:dolichol kinase
MTSSEGRDLVQPPQDQGEEIKATRSSLQIGRRLFHFLNGTIVATMYNLFLTHKQVVYVLGLTASLVYLIDQVRVSYPEISRNFNFLNKLLLRAEEQLKQSAAVPYAMSLLLTILSFPKEISLIAIYTLSIADPLSAIIGIKFGKHKIAKNKSLEGSGAFFISTFFISFFVLSSIFIGITWPILKASFLIALLAALAELVPSRLDDNLTIPLFTAILAWIVCSGVGIPIGQI